MSGKNDKDQSHKRKNDKPCEGRRYAIPSPKFITALADSCGISGLNDETVAVLGEDVSFRLREILFNCTVHLRSNKEKKLRSYHVDRALPGGTERVHGFLSGGSANFLYASEADAYVYQDTLIDVDLLALALSNDKYIQMGEVFLRGVWFLPDEIHPEISSVDAPIDCPSLTPVSINYYHRIVRAILSKHDKLYIEAINDLVRNPKIAHVIPYFLNLLGEGIQGELRGGIHCMRFLEMVRALTFNQYIYRDATVMVNELLTNLLICALDPTYATGPGVVDDYELRATAADVLACVVKHWYRSNVKLLRDIVQKLGQVLFDGNSSLRSHYGALVTLCSLGIEALNYCLLPHLEQYLTFVASLGLDYEGKELEGPLLHAAEILYEYESGGALKRPLECHPLPDERIRVLDSLLYSYFGDAICARRPCCTLFNSATSEGTSHVRSGEDSVSSSVIKDNVSNDFEMEYRNWTAIAKIPNRIVPLCDNANPSSGSHQRDRRNTRRVDVRNVFDVPPKLERVRPIMISSIRGVSAWPHELRNQRGNVAVWRTQYRPRSLYQVKSCRVNCVGKLARKHQPQRSYSFDLRVVL